MSNLSPTAGVIKKEVIVSYHKFRELQDLLDEILPDREHDLTDAIIEGVKEIGCIQKEKSAAEMQTLGEFLVCPIPGSSVVPLHCCVLYPK